MYSRKFCGKEYNNYLVLGGHASKCEKNPNSENTKIKIGKAAKSTSRNYWI